MQDDFLEERENDLRFSDTSLSKLAEKYETPFFVYSSEIIEQSYGRFRDSFSEKFDIFYSVKANPNLHILRLLRDMGAGMEIASLGELALCKELGIPGERIVFAGPGKTDEELREAIEYGILAINAESFNEVKRVDKIAGDLGKEQGVNLRINPDFKASGDIILSGKPSKFGIDEEEISRVEKLTDLDNIDLKGIHVFSASQVLDSEKLVEYMGKVFSLVEKAEEYFEVELVDIGTGFGIPYGEDGERIDIGKIGSEVEDLVEKFGFEDKDFVLESGRYLVGSSGVYITEVIDKKQSRGKNFVITKGGINHFLRPQLIGTSHGIINITSDDKEREVLDVGGQLCTSLDFLGKDVDMKRTSRGDLLAVLNTGAYGLTESMLFFLSHETPLEILINDEGEELVIRKRTKPKDLINKQRK